MSLYIAAVSCADKLYVLARFPVVMSLFIAAVSCAE
jgi:hypothetical protein